jgi:hypothetical protein
MENSLLLPMENKFKFGEHLDSTGNLHLLYYTEHIPVIMTIYCIYHGALIQGTCKAGRLECILEGANVPLMLGFS